MFSFVLFFFFFNDTATTEIYTLSLHDALPISNWSRRNPLTSSSVTARASPSASAAVVLVVGDRKSTRLNSSHLVISYAVFCLKKKKNKNANRNDVTYNYLYVQYESHIYDA